MAQVAATLVGSLPDRSRTEGPTARSTSPTPGTGTSSGGSAAETGKPSAGCSGGTPRAPSRSRGGRPPAVPGRGDRPGGVLGGVEEPGATTTGAARSARGSWAWCTTAPSTPSGERSRNAAARDAQSNEPVVAPRPAEQVVEELGLPRSGGRSVPRSTSFPTNGAPRVIELMYYEAVAVDDLRRLGLPLGTVVADAARLVRRLRTMARLER